MKDLKMLSDQQLTNKIKTNEYNLSLLKNLINSSIILGVMSTVFAGCSYLLGFAAVGVVFAVTAVLQLFAISGCVGLGFVFKSKNKEIQKEKNNREIIADKTKEYQDEKSNNLKHASNYTQVKGLNVYSKDDDLTKGL